jgi:hypothetical protein
MKYKLLLVIILLSIVTISCNPELYIVGSGMRYHNLSQNKYQPNKYRKRVRVGKSDNSPVFIFLRRR